MGLDTDFDCWHGPYSSFKAFRDHVRTAAGLDLDVAHLECDGEMRTYALTGPYFPAYAVEGTWREAPPEPLWILLMHSDCEGIIQTGHCELLADALERVLPYLPEGWATDKCQQFIDGLRDAWAHGEDVTFH